ncbi:hypothetical protein [Streptomyces sp. BPTC-684]|uniref:hypothetical protein n=1 Tax=Streptomyces sp. BPTC-684 TaxID=3043734 RepID=UPI0024B1F767|nr:hypothetical protein [Streptomyces sp. BPTC-684]WHM37547.1 hypothetical protein QIY60_11960 [Streptomyces sp. BPTC-684]
MFGQLGLQRTLQDQLHQPGQQATLAHQLEPFPAGSLHQLLGQSRALLGHACQLGPRPHLALALAGAALLVLAAHL